jgi:hypothetical protein
MRFVRGLLVTGCVACASGSQSTPARAPSDTGSTERCADVPGEKTSPGLPARALCVVVMASYPAFRSCYERHASVGAERGVVTISWSIEPSGAVSSATIVRNTFPDNAVANCVREKTEQLSYPSAAQPTGGSWTFAFRPRSEDGRGSSP